MLDWGVGGGECTMMIHHKLSEMAVVDGRGVVESDGNHYSVDADTRWGRQRYPTGGLAWQLGHSWRPRL